MTAEIFVDTNIWLYASSNAREDRAKREIAREVIRRRGVGLSTQVMQEFYDAAVRKMRLNIVPEAALEILRRMGPFPVLSVSRELVLRAVEIHQRYQLRYYDAAIVGAAMELGASQLVSEDFSAHQAFGRLAVVNPFGAD
jgi:predicted nucleic acid-binding protein